VLLLLMGRSVLLLQVAVVQHSWVSAGSSLWLRGSGWLLLESHKARRCSSRTSSSRCWTLVQQQQQAALLVRCRVPMLLRPVA
jgi:hypothetical protein